MKRIIFLSTLLLCGSGYADTFLCGAHTVRTSPDDSVMIDGRRASSSYSGTYVVNVEGISLEFDITKSYSVGNDGHLVLADTVYTLTQGNPIENDPMICEKQ